MIRSAVALNPERVRTYREDYRREQIPARYSGWRHLAITTALCVGAIAAALSQIAQLSPVELTTVPLAWLAANFVEYGVHRGPMHHLRPGASRLYKRHTSIHHRFFSEQMMAVDGARDFHVTLFPAWIVLLFVGVIALPLAVVVGWLISPDVGLLFYAALVFYYLVYEWLHLASHMPETSVLGGLPGAALARRHHGTHHDPALMRRANFNFALPLADRLFGTLCPARRGDPEPPDLQKTRV